MVILKWIWNTCGYTRQRYWTVILTEKCGMKLLLVTSEMVCSRSEVSCEVSSQTCCWLQSLFCSSMSVCHILWWALYHRGQVWKLNHASWLVYSQWWFLSLNPAVSWKPRNNRQLYSWMLKAPSPFFTGPSNITKSLGASIGAEERSFSSWYKRAPAPASVHVVPLFLVLCSPYVMKVIKQNASEVWQIGGWRMSGCLMQIIHNLGTSNMQIFSHPL